MSRSASFAEEQTDSTWLDGGRDSVLLTNIDWRTYSVLLRSYEQLPGHRLAYDDGRLEIMSPSTEHESDNRLLAQLVVALTEAWGLPLRHGGSMTMRASLKRKGIEPDSCFWIRRARELRIARRGPSHWRAGRDLPPDLAIEVDVTSSSLNRLAIYAVFGVPELWRLDADGLQFLALRRKSYETVAESITFPTVEPNDLMKYVRRARTAFDQNQVVAQFRKWASRIGPPA